MRPYHVSLLVLLAFILGCWAGGLAMAYSYRLQRIESQRYQEPPTIVVPVKRQLPIEAM